MNLVRATNRKNGKLSSIFLLIGFLSALSLSAQELFPLWDPDVKLPGKNELPTLENVEFSVIKPYEFHIDGYRFLHGVALIWHEDKLYASFGHNKNREN